MKEGNYDYIWKTIIDHLWSDNTQFPVLLRKEILSVRGPFCYDGIHLYYDFLDYLLI